MKRFLVMLWMFCSVGLSSQQIVDAEYYIDIDPGLGSGTPISITDNQDISDLLVPIDIAGVSEGIHNLIVRAKDENGSWSLSHEQTFLKSQLPSSSPIDALEYYFDNDPGEGNGSPISITASADILNHSSLISISGISEGVHRLNIRARNEEGVWSHVESKTVYVSAPEILYDIVKLEYYMGADPGFGSGTAISITPANDVSEISAVVPFGDLEFGVNQLSVRGLNSKGQWSHSSTNAILKMKVPDVPDVVELEYFFNVDPGFGSGTNVSLGAQPDWPDASVLINTNGLADGLHILYIRTKDSNGVWSFSESTIIQKSTVENLSDITGIEYFFDIDPGFGSGMSIGVTPETDIENHVTTISVAGLSKGIHTLFLRTKNTLGEWSLSQTKSILIANPKTTKDIVSLEYYFDSDPGFGGGTPISFSAMPDITDLNSVIALSGLTNGVHHLFIRSKDSNGIWSQTYNRAFLYRAPDVVENIQKMEYYIGDDPGFGNGLDISVPSMPAVSDIVDLQRMIDINTLDAGVQRLSIRSQNDLGVWTHTYTQPIYVYKNVNGDMVKAEYYIGDDPGYGMATEISFAPETDKSDHIFPIDIAGLGFGVHRLHVRYMSENNKWSMDEITPFYVRDGELYEIFEGEYFFDEDPGLGMATPFAFTAGVDIPDISIIIMTTGLDVGEHDLYIRSKNEKGEWSLTNVEFDIEVEGALPLNLLSFDVSKRGDEALLEWKVIEAVNTSHFEIERTDNTDFKYLGRVESINTLDERMYQFTDSKPYEGQNYYRLKQVDLDGEFQYSAIRSAIFNQENKLTVYPNPTIDEIRVDGNLGGETSFHIYDSNSKLVKKGDVKPNTSIDVRDLNAGAYHFILHNGAVNSSFLLIKI